MPVTAVNEHRDLGRAEDHVCRPAKVWQRLCRDSVAEAVGVDERWISRSGFVSRLRMACMFFRRAAEDAQDPSGGVQASGSDTAIQPSVYLGACRQSGTWLAVG